MSIASVERILDSEKKANGRDRYLIELLQERPSLDTEAMDAEMTAWLQAIREHAAVLVTENIFPTKRDEEWRFTDLSPLLEVKFAGVSSDKVSSVRELSLAEADSSCLVFVNGIYAPQLSDVSGLPENVFVGNLLAGKIPPAELKKYLAKQQGAEEVFTLLNSASLTDAAIVWVPKNQAIDRPIHLLFISTRGEVATISQPRCLVVAEAGSSLTIVEDYTAAANCPEALLTNPYFTNAVTEIWVDENAEVNHTRVQREAGGAFHIGKSAIAQARDSRYTCNAISLGARLSRHNLELCQNGEGTYTTLNGLTQISGTQLADTHSAIGYNHANGTSKQLHKCIVDGKAHAVFNGKIFVPKPAQLTDAAQLNRNLLLSPQARVDTKPQLEITADNVKCAHGATVGQLDPEEVFYLQSRGLDRETSCNLLVDAFAGEILDRIPVASLKQMLSRCVACR